MGGDEETIRRVLDRLHALRINRIRVALAWRVKNGRVWFENVFPTDKFKFVLNPWEAERPDDVENPRYDVTRFNVPYWQKWDRMMKYAKEKGIVVSAIFYVDGRRPGTDPFGKAGMGGPDEQRYYRYAAARLSAFPNLMWDVANEYRHFRNDARAEKMGTFLKKPPPARPRRGDASPGAFPWRGATRPPGSGPTRAPDGAPTREEDGSTGAATAP